MGAKGTNPKKTVSLRGKYDKHGVKENIFAGFLFCGDCHKKLVRYKDATETSVRYYQQCRVYNENLSNGCIQKSTREEVLEATILSFIRSQINIAMDIKKLIVRFNKTSAYKKRIDALQKSIATINQKIKRNTTLKNKLFESLEGREISEDDFLYMKERYNAESAGYKEMMQELISHVWVWADNRFEVVLNYRNEFGVIMNNIKGAAKVCQKHSLSI